jgi:hypothetical protein
MGRKSLHLLSVLVMLAGGSVGVRAAPFQQDAGPDGLVSIEAEHYDKNTPQGGHTWELVGPTGGFTGEAGMQALPDSGANTNDNYLTDAPRLDYEINFVKTGTYYVWVRGWGVDGGADSIHSGLDNQAIATADRITGFMTNYRWTNAAYEDPERIMFDVTTPGKHTLNIWMREDGAIVDKIVLTTNPDYQPTGDGPPESKRGLPVLATNPSPAAGATDVPRDTLLAWNASTFAQTHDAYFGTVFADVNAAGRTDRKGVLASQGQAEAMFDPPDLLDFGTTYYWRVDEINAPPDNTLFKGDVWSFTVEPYGYPVQPIAATASSAQANMGPEKTIDGSGMTGDRHGIEPTTMWLSAGVQPNWIQYEFDRVYQLHELQVWNFNQLLESFLGFGAKEVTIETSIDGATWTPVANVPEFAKAPAAPDYAANTTVDLGGAEAKYVKLTITSNWGGVAPQTGLSEVRFSYVPVAARMPQPANNAGGISLNRTLDWRPGRETTSHQVFFGTDVAAVAAGTAPGETVSEHGFDPGMLDFGTFYYWKVDEIGTATYPGSVWSFSTLPYQAVDDFESYTDQAGEEIFAAWIDGVTTGLSGSTVGYFTASGGTFGETTIVHGGRQSMPLQYDNTKAPFISEAERTFASAQNWTTNGAENLVVYFRGLDPASATQPEGNSAEGLYLVVEDASGKTKVVQHPDPVGTNATAWQAWAIPLSEFTSAGVKMTAVKSLTIGVGNKAAPKAGGTGTVYIDDIGFGKPLQWVAQPAEILLEAESATSITAPMVVYDDPLASGGKCIGTPTTQADSTGNPPATGIAQIPFTVPGGKYKLRFRVIIPGDNNSVWVRIADGTTQTANHASGWVRFNEIPSGDDWHWQDVYSNDDNDEVVEWTLAPGPHTLEIAYREAGARVDVIVIEPLN